MGCSKALRPCITAITSSGRNPNRTGYYPIAPPATAPLEICETMSHFLGPPILCGSTKDKTKQKTHHLVGIQIGPATANWTFVKQGPILRPPFCLGPIKKQTKKHCVAGLT